MHNFTIDICVWEKNAITIGSSTTHGIRHPLRVLEYILTSKGWKLLRNHNCSEYHQNDTCRELNSLVPTHSLNHIPTQHCIVHTLSCERHLCFGLRIIHSPIILFTCPCPLHSSYNNTWKESDFQPKKNI